MKLIQVEKSNVHSGTLFKNCEKMKFPGKMSLQICTYLQPHKGQERQKDIME